LDGTFILGEYGTEVRIIKITMREKSGDSTKPSTGHGWGRKVSNSKQAIESMINNLNSLFCFILLP
jgi:hypothetical protein